MDLTNKVVLVTGGSRGLGKEIALAFGREGCNVVVNYRDSYEEAEEVVRDLQYGGMRIKCDVSNVNEVRDMFELITDTYDGLDVLVNNAGYTQAIPHHDLEGLFPALFHKVMDINVCGTYHCIRKAVTSGAMLEGSIVNVSSIAAQTAKGSNVAYGASKAAIENMTKALGRALGPNIRVNAVAPGLMETGMTEEWKDYHVRAKETNPLRREPSLEDVAKVVVDLTKNDSITGTIVNVDAGQSLV